MNTTRTLPWLLAPMLLAAAVQGQEFRSIDGSGNNLLVPDLNAAGAPLRRRMYESYADGISAMPHGANPRAISNAVADQTGDVPAPGRRSDYLWQWGQFLDHDISLSLTNPGDLEAIPIPAGDPHFDAAGTGAKAMVFSRSVYADGTGVVDPRQQLNALTGWIDASQIYGSDAVQAAFLRTNDGTGYLLKTSAGNLLPLGDDGLFVAGDVRVNEQIGLTAMHTLFVREHNRLAEIIKSTEPTLTDEEVYQRARRLVGALMQAITYNEFIPALLGRHALAHYRGYDPLVDARIMNAFSTAAFRLGHSLLSPKLLRLDQNGNEIPSGHVPLRSAFFAPHLVIADGIEPILRGLARQVCQRLDGMIVDEVRNFLFGEPTAGGFDLASLNIQRGRDHGLPTYNVARKAMGKKPAATFADVSSDPEVQTRLAGVYASIDDIDLWVGGLAEDPVPGALVGELFFALLKEQFEALRDGDRFWYQITLTAAERLLIERTSLSDVIVRNTTIRRGEIQERLFYVARPANP